MAKKGTTIVVRCAKAAKVEERARHHAEADELEPTVPDPVHRHHGEDVARDGEDDEDPERPEQLGLQGGRGIDLLQDGRQRERVAVVGVVEEEPDPGRAEQEERASDGS